MVAAVAVTVGLTTGGLPAAQAAGCVGTPSVFKPSFVRAQGVITASGGCPRGRNLAIGGRLIKNGVTVIATVNITKGSGPGVSAVTPLANVGPNDRLAMTIDTFTFVPSV